jgi:hypothetical protein
LNGIGFTVQSDNVATLLLSSQQLGKSKAVRFRTEWAKDDPSSRVEWALAVPKNEASKPAPSPSFLRVGDSQKVSFTGGDLCQTTKNYTVTFENTPLTAICNDENSSLDVFITTAVTRLFGHKELILNAVGVPIKPGTSPPTLPIDVLRQ